ncbi:unnamed protein product [Urochloa humidicola]
MATLILSMDVSGGYSRIRRAINDVAGVENVEVYPDTGRVVVTGWADKAEVVARLESRLRTTVTIVSYRKPKLEISSADEDDSSDDDGDDDDEEASSSSSEEDDDDGDQAAGGWNGSKRTPQPWSGDEPVPDPTSGFFDFTL